MKNWTEFEAKFPLIGQSLRTARQNGRLSHSYLVVSSNPSLRNDFPTLLASLAVCTDPNADGSPCGRCPNCTKLANGLYMDLHLLAPTSKSRQITIGTDSDEPDTLRNFESKFYLTSSEPGAWKIGFIYDCDAMNKNAQNAFLKTLEEPPKNCMFVLCTGRPYTLLPTIRSRCQILTLSDNVCKYDLTLFDGLPEVLFDLTFRGDGTLAHAESCASGLIAILSSLKTKAEESVNAKWEPRMESINDNLESSAKKTLEKRMLGEIGCEYLRLREEFLSMIHSWFAQVLFLVGADAESLPNPEIMEPWLDADPRPVLPEREAVRMLGEAEYLLRVLNTNVNDELAVRSFALSVAVRTDTDAEA